MKTVLVFGTFDGLHPGHLTMLKSARSFGDKLTVSLSPDAQVEQLKGRGPIHPYADRRQALIETKLVDEIIESDRDLNSFGVIDQIKPDVIALGYDQNELHDSLKNWLGDRHLEIKVLEPFEPDQYKSSLLR